MSTWVHRIVTNSALTRLRRRKIRAEIELKDYLPEYDRNGFLKWPTDRVVQSLDQLMEHEQTAREVEEVMKMLPGDHREVVLLRDLEGYTTAETAEILGIAPGAVKVRLHRARSALRALLLPVILRGDG